MLQIIFSVNRKRKDSQQTMYYLKSSENGKLLLNQTEMQGEVRNFFRQLYTENLKIKNGWNSILASI